MRDVEFRLAKNRGQTNGRKCMRAGLIWRVRLRRRAGLRQRAGLRRRAGLDDRQD